jgi:glycine/D-amino acid oxidase-like deaminating enzyme
VYATTADERFVIARDPARPTVVVASAGAGHALKFAPVLGDLVADAVEDRPPTFGWPL